MSQTDGPRPHYVIPAPMTDQMVRELANTIFDKIERKFPSLDPDHRHRGYMARRGGLYENWRVVRASVGQLLKEYRETWRVLVAEFAQSTLAVNINVAPFATAMHAGGISDRSNPPSGTERTANLLFSQGRSLRPELRQLFVATALWEGAALRRDQLIRDVLTNPVSRAADDGPAALRLALDYLVGFLEDPGIDPLHRAHNATFRMISTLGHMLWGEQALAGITVMRIAYRVGSAELEDRSEIDDIIGNVFRLLNEGDVIGAGHVILGAAARWEINVADADTGELVDNLQAMATAGISGHATPGALTRPGMRPSSR